MMNLKEYKNKIINADCLDVLRKLPDKCVDLVLTDPPYGIGSKFKSKFGLNVAYKEYDKFDWNNKIPSEEIFMEMFRVSKHQIIFGGNYFTVHLKPTNAWIVWDKIGQYNLKNPFSDCELAWTSFSFPMKKYTNVNMGFITGKEEKGKRIHPTQKPLKLFQAILQDFSKPGNIILDPFSGSGTTAVAAHNLGRRFVCIEKDRGYWEASVKRLEDARKQISIFELPQNKNLTTKGIK